MTHDTLTSLTIDDAGTGGWTTVDARSHYGQAVWRWNAEAIAPAGAIGQVLTPWDDGVQPCEVLWADEDWTILHCPTWDADLTAVHLDSGAYGRLLLSIEPGPEDIVDSRAQLDEYGPSDQMTTQALTDLIRAGRVRPEHAVADWTGETLGLLV